MVQYSNSKFEISHTIPMPTSQVSELEKFLRLLFIIPARSGSKGVPGKNIRLVGGVPLIGRAINTCARCVDILERDNLLSNAKILPEIVCSTDSSEYANIAEAYGAIVPSLRPEYLAHDKASTMDVIHYEVTQYASRHKVEPSLLILVQCTCPFTRAEDLLSGILSVLTPTGCSDVSEGIISSRSAVSVTKREPFGWHMMMHPTSGGLKPVAEIPHQRQADSQADSFVVLNGQFYIASPTYLRRYGDFISRGSQDAISCGVLVPQAYSFDIDHEFEVRLCDVWAPELAKRDSGVLIEDPLHRSSNKLVAILGSGGHAKVIISALLLNWPGAAVNVYDDDPDKEGKFLCIGNHSFGIRSTSELEQIRQDQSHMEAFLAVGDNRSRERMCRALSDRVKWHPGMIHPQAIVAKDVVLSVGVVVLAGAVVQTGTRVGAHSIVNSRASVDHDCQIGCFAHVGPGAVLCGHVAANEGSFLGAGCTVKQCLSVGPWCTLGMGACLTRSMVTPNETWIGVPARKK